MGTRERARLSTKEKEGCHVLCDELKDLRRPGAAGYSFPHKQTSKNKQFHPTEKETGQQDMREGQTGVKKEWHQLQRAWREKLDEITGGADDKGISWKDPQTSCLLLSGLLDWFGFQARTSYFDHPGTSWIMYHSPLAFGRGFAVSLI